MSNERHFLIPWVDQTSPEIVAKVPVVALEKRSPPLDALLPHCVPSPFAEAEVMASILRALPAGGGTFADVKPNAFLRQSFVRWQTLLKAVLLGRISIEQVSLKAPDNDPVNFGRALFRSRSSRQYQGVLRSYSTLVPAGRKSRLVGGVDEHTLVWAGPRLQDGEWGVLNNTVHGAEENLAISLLFEWRRMLTEKGLWSGEGNAPPWMRGVDAMLEGRKPTHTWDQLQADAAMEVPCRLLFPRSNAEPVLLDVYLPVYRPGHATQFERIFHLRPAMVDGGINLLEDRSDGAPARIGAFVQLTAHRNSTPDGATLRAGDVGAGDELLAGLGRVEMRDLNLAGDRWWLQDRDGVVGYKSAVYDPLIDQVLKVQGQRLALKPDDVAACPIFFPDAVRLARELLSPPEGMNGVEYGTLKYAFGAKVAHWALPRYGQQLTHELPLPSLDKPYVLALDHSHSAPCLVERVDVGGILTEVGEIRALGALLWEVFIGETDFRTADSHALQRISIPTRDNSVASQARDSEQRIVLKSPLLGAIGSVLSDDTGQSVGYKRRVQKRRATAQRFLSLWSDVSPALGAGYWLASLASRTFLEWAFAGSEQGPLALWGRRPDLERERGRKLKVTQSLELPLFNDVYPQKL